MSIFTVSEGTAARRRFHLYLVDATDGLTPETGEAAGQPQISKNGGAYSNTTATLTAIGNGAYYVELTATELNTLGEIAIRYKSANTAEFFGEAKVLNADLFGTPNVNVSTWLASAPNALTSGRVDAIVGAYGSGLAPLQPTVAGRTLDVTTTGEAGIDWANIGGPTSAQTLSGTTVGTATTIGATGINAVADQVWDEAIAGHLGAGSTGEALSNATAPSAAAVADAVWDEAVSGHTSDGTFGLNNTLQALGVVNYDTAAAGSSTTITLGTSASTTSDMYIGNRVDIVFGVGAGQSRIITDYVGATKVATVESAWAFNPSSSSVYMIRTTGGPILSAPTAASIADAVWDEAMSGHLSAGSFGEQLASLPTASGIDTVLTASHGSGSWVDAGGLTAASVADAVWDELMADHTVSGSFGEGLQTLEDAVLIWPTPVGGGVTAETLIARAMTIADVHDNFVSEAEWLRWLNQEQYSLRLMLARNGWTLPFDTTTATITSTGWSLVTDGASAEDIDRNDAGHFIFTPTLADVMALVSIHELRNGSLLRLSYNNTVDFLKQSLNGTNSVGRARDYRLRMYGNEIHADFYPTPAVGETYLITYLSAPVQLTATDQSVALPMGWEERLVLGMARRALIKEESDPSQVERLLKEMDSEIEQLCWSRVTSEAARVRNTDPNLGIPDWQSWWWL